MMDDIRLREGTGNDPKSTPCGAWDRHFTCTGAKEGSNHTHVTAGSSGKHRGRILG